MNCFNITLAAIYYFHNSRVILCQFEKTFPDLSVVLKRPRIKPVNDNIFKQVSLICILVVHFSFLVWFPAGTFKSLLNRYIDDDVVYLINYL